VGDAEDIGLLILRPPLIKRWEAVRGSQDFRNSRGVPFLDNGKKGIIFLLR
jgi:hypothetical protein